MTDQPQAPRYRLISPKAGMDLIYDDRYQDRVFPHRLENREIVDLLNELETLRAVEYHARDLLNAINSPTWKYIERSTQGDPTPAIPSRILLDLRDALAQTKGAK